MEAFADRQTASTILESITDGFYALDRQWRFTYINLQAELLLKRQRADLLGKNVWDEFPEAIDSILYEQYHKAAAEQVAVNFEVFYPPLDSWFEIRAYPSENGLLVYFLNINQRIESQKALRRSEARYRSLVIATSQAVWTTNAQGQVVEDNPSWRMLTGQSEDAIEDWGWLDAIHPEDRRQSVESWFEAVKNKIYYETEHRLRVADGSYRYFAVRGVPVLDENDRILEWVGTHTDISSRKLAEAALQQSEERFRRAILDAPLPIMLHAEDGEVLQINYAWTELTGYTHADIPTIEDWTQKAYGSRKASVKADIEGLHLLNKRVSEGEYAVTTANGEKRIWDFYSAPLGSLPDGRSLVISTAIDVTDRTKAEQEQQKLASIVENCPDFIAMANLDCQLLFINSAGQKLIGLEGMEAVRKTQILDFRTPDEWKYIQQEVLPIVFERGRWEGETTISHYCTGEKIPVHQVIFLNRDKKTGQPLNIASVIRDIRERKQAEAQIHQLYATLERRVEEKTAQLEAANQELEAFAYTIAHDLRAPLRGMHGLAEALLEDYSKYIDEVGQEYARHIVTSAQQLESLIQDLLAYSRLSRAELKLQSVNLDTVIAQALSQVKADPDYSPARITVESPLPCVIAHRTTLVQVVTNLLSNAVKFVKDTEPQVRVWAETSDAWVKLWVSDNGIGIACEHQPRIWRVFERLHGIEAYPGTGIGLAIVQKAIQRMGGEVGVESQLGQGSRFFFALRSGVDS